MSFNKVIIMGNLGRDPELKFTAKKTPVCNLNLASSERQKNQQGEWDTHTEWHRVVVFGKQAENCSKYLNKGSQALIEGKIRTNKWTDKSGNDRYSTEIWADSVKFVGSKSSNAGGGGGYSGQDSQYDQGAANSNDSVLDSLPSADELTGGADAISDDDIPF